jgi:polysaccharide deacetylase family protein (PEP-CTERM system associated)
MINNMNVLTFDIEEWFLEKTYHGDRKENYVVFDKVLEGILDVLDEANTKATFFCLGELANYFPYVIKKIESRGHEIGCHSNKHIWLNKLTRKELIEDTTQAIVNLEQCVGRKVLSYRAPAFSIGDSNKWAFEVLSNCGIERDASVFPAVRDFGGFSSFGQMSSPVLVSHKDTLIKEFPIVTTNIFGKKIVYSGGGYFRFFPFFFIQNELKKSGYSMSYFHIGDLLPNNKLITREEYETYFRENGSLKNRYVRYIKSNFGTKSAKHKLYKLLSSIDFINLEQADKMIDWSLVKVKNI